MKSTGEDLTDLLDRASRGDDGARDRVVAAAYGELRRIAAAVLRSKPGATLNPTALVHEAYLKLFEGASPTVRDRRHFFALSARAMRQILVDHYRARASWKRGAGLDRVTLLEGLEAESAPGDVILAVHRALEKLAELDERLARVVELKFFGGWTLPETAEALGVTARTVSSDWRAARAWLTAELEAG